jgi:hypothetical protein
VAIVIENGYSASAGIYGAYRSHVGVLDNSAEEPGQDEVKKAGRHSSPAECETCKNRKYQDGSDENVSYKAATHISPQAAASAVRAHEGEHVANAYVKAAQKDGRVLSVGVSIHTAVCPECGRVYVSGGETSEAIAIPKNGGNPYEKQKKAVHGMLNLGLHADAAV